MPYPEILGQITLALYGAVKGLEFMHNNSYIHMDIKPQNILLDPKRRALLADLGFAKHLTETPSQETTVGFTFRYAHPDVLSYNYTMVSPNRAIIPKLKYSQFRKIWDIYALGQSTLEVLSLVDQKYPDAALHNPQFKYLHLMACRMLDGKNTGSSRFAISEFGSSLNSKAFDDIRYLECGEIRRDLEKELGITLIDHEVPELDSHSRKTIHGAEWRATTLTRRLGILLEHPLMRRLSRISQLGVARLVYPTASHSRFDHVLGTYTNACSYIDALYHDENPLFRQIVNKKDAEALLLASLLHDLGQYPLAHDIEEVEPNVRHLLFTEELLDSAEEDSEHRTLKQIIEGVSGWENDVARIKEILWAQDSKRQRLGSSFRARLLSTILDGPIDSDKTDYLIRDSKECRLHYGEAIDFERLMKTITIHYDSDKDTIQLAIYDKGRPCAESIAFTRYLMFASVYWHHTARSCKSMVQYAFLLVLKSGIKRDNLTGQLRKFLLSLESDRSSKQNATLLDLVRNAGGAENLAETDIAIIDWLYQRGSPDAQELLLMVASRKLFKRLASLHYSAVSVAPAGGLTNWHRFQDIATRWNERLSLCRRLQARLLAEVRVHAKEHHSVNLSEEKLTEFDALMAPEHLSILVDIPEVKDLGKPLKFVKETMEQRNVDDAPPETLSQLSELWAGPIFELFKSIAVVRVFCHESVKPVIRAVFDVDEIIQIGLEELDKITTL
jgi:HD superfamily phosphohydrolase